MYTNLQRIKTAPNRDKELVCQLDILKAKLEFWELLQQVWTSYHKSHRKERCTVILQAAFPFGVCLIFQGFCSIECIQTDNGAAFTNRFTTHRDRPTLFQVHLWSSMASGTEWSVLIHTGTMTRWSVATGRTPRILCHPYFLFLCRLLQAVKG